MTKVVDVRYKIEYNCNNNNTVKISYVMFLFNERNFFFRIVRSFGKQAKLEFDVLERQNVSKLEGR